MEKNIQNLCAKAIADKLTHTEQEEFDSWLAESDKNRADFESLAEAWDHFPTTTGMGSEYKSQDWQRLRKRLGFEEKAGWASKFFGRSLKPALATAAVLLILLSITKWAGFYPFQKTPDIYSIVAQQEILKDIKLPDGSTVVLNRGSRLDLTDNLDGNKRQLELQGEAFFDVAHDQARPFIVSTSNGEVQVLGTRFNVWARNNETRIILEQGRVKLTSTESGMSQVLNPGELSQIIADTSPTEPVKINIDQRLGWMDGRLIFIKSTLNEVAEELERYYDVSISVTDISLLRQTLTATFDNQSLETVLESICITLNAEYERNAKSIIIKRS